MRAFAEKSVEQARQAFESFLSTAHQTINAFGDQAETTRQGAKGIGQQVMAFAERNIASSFEFAQHLVRARDVALLRAGPRLPHARIRPAHAGVHGAATDAARPREPHGGRALARRRESARAGDEAHVSHAAEFLTRIADDRRRRVAQMKLEMPPHLLRARLVPGKANGRLERALRRGGSAGALKLLCEIKRASPSKGLLNENLDPVALARVYAAGGAAAISIVTEPDHFRGELDWIDRVRPVTSLPLLLKDFVLDSYQLLDAAVRGADGVLLLASLLSETELQRLTGEAKILGLDPLVEVHSKEELNAALRAGATLVGINHRNLHTFELDMTLGERLLPLVPPMVTAVAESGLSKPADLAKLRTTRCDAVLMGEVFSTSTDPAATLATLVAAARGVA